MQSACVLTSCTQGSERTKEAKQESSTAAVIGKTANPGIPSASNSFDVSTALVPAAPGDILKPGDTTSAGDYFQCAPAVFTQRDTITVRMEHPHGEYLIVAQPDGTYFFLTYPKPAEPSNYLLLSSNAFAQMPTIRFKASIKARPQIFGRDTLETVFSKPGKCLVTVGHKMETERGSDITKCAIRMVPS